MQRGDGCLHLQRTWPPLDKGLLDERESFGDRVAVPTASVLLLERCLGPVRVDARVAPGMVQQHEREQSSRLGLVGQEVEQQTPEPDRLVAQLPTHESVALGRAVALVEHEVDHRQRGIETIGQQCGRRQGERNVRGFHLPLGPHEPLRHRRLGHEEGPCDRCGRQTVDDAQGQCDLRVEGQGGVAAEEDEAELIVGHEVAVDVGLGVLQCLQCLQRPHSRHGALRGARGAEPVDCPSACRRRDPRRRPPRHAGRRPGAHSDGECLLHGLLGDVETASEANEAADDAAPLVAEDGLDRLAHLSRRGRHIPGIAMTGRTSTEPYSAPGILAAYSSAWSRFSQSRM